jgi:hypothetical protein
VNQPLIDDFLWLTSADASPYLEQAAASSAELVRQAQTLRTRLSAERTHLVLEQVSLRDRAREKFTRASQMFFTPTLLEQATEERIAAYKGQRFPAGPVITDLGCGLGGDLIGLATRGPVLGVDRNPVATILAQTNARVYTNREIGLRVADVHELLDEMDSLWHIDPDRRPTGQRSTHAELFEPSVAALEHLLARYPHGAIKLAAATPVPNPWEAVAEREWIGSRRECRQQVAWFGSLALFPASHRATVIESDGSSYSVAGQPDLSLPVSNSIQSFLFEPHAAVLAAQLAGNLALLHGLAFLAKGIAYLTGETPVASPLLSCFSVLEVLPFDLRKLRAALATRRVGRLEIKVRGVDVDPNRLRQKLRPRGDEELTMFITGPHSHIRAVFAKRWRVADVSPPVDHP